MKLMNDSPCAVGNCDIKSSYKDEMKLMFMLLCSCLKIQVLWDLNRGANFVSHGLVGLVSP
jgi:hypothetical protein